MNLIKKRAQEQFPVVLLTLLSIVQALALELLWSYVQESDYLFDGTRVAFVSWAQIATALFGIILIWVSYASNAMRFRWTPSTADSIYPFIIGLLEFMLVASLQPHLLGQWVILMAVIFGTMVVVSQLTMRRARVTGDNGDFFEGVNPATLKDFIPQAVIVLILLASGSYISVSGNTGTFSHLIIAAIIGLLLWQYVSTVKFWNSSVRDVD